MAHALDRVGDSESARAYFEKVLDYCSDESPIFRLFAMRGYAVHLLRTGAQDEGRAWFEEAIKFARARGEAAPWHLGETFTLWARQEQNLDAGSEHPEPCLSQPVANLSRLAIDPNASEDSCWSRPWQHAPSQGCLSLTIRIRGMDADGVARNAAYDDSVAEILGRVFLRIRP